MNTLCHTSIVCVRHSSPSDEKMSEAKSVEEDHAQELNKNDTQWLRSLKVDKFEDLFPIRSTLITSRPERPQGKSSLEAIFTRMRDSIGKVKTMMSNLIVLTSYIGDQRILDLSNSSIEQLEEKRRKGQRVDQKVTRLYQKIITCRALVEFNYIETNLKGRFEHFKSQKGISVDVDFIDDLCKFHAFMQEEVATINALKRIAQDVQEFQASYDHYVKRINDRKAELSAAQTNILSERENLRLLIIARYHALLISLTPYEQLYQAGKDYLELIHCLFTSIDSNNVHSDLSLNLVSQILFVLSDRLENGMLTQDVFLTLVPKLYEAAELNVVLDTQLEMITAREIHSTNEIINT